MARPVVVLVVLLLAAAACERDGPTAPSGGRDAIEFRVFGANLLPFSPITIRHTDSIGGLTLYQGGVPYFAAVSSRERTVFLFIEALGTGSFTSTLQVQIYVNGRLFREGFTQGLTLSAQASGTFRR